MSNRLPTVGGDSGAWGTILNDFLEVAHNADGTLADASATETTLSLSDVTTANATSSLHGFLPKLDNNTAHFLRGDGTWQAPPGADKLGLTPTAVKTSAYNAVVGDFIPVDTTSGSVTVTLPTAPADGSVIGVKQVIRGSTNTVTIAAGGSDVFNKAGGATSATLTVVNASVLLQYKNSSAIWYVVSDDTPYSQVVDSVTAGDTSITIGGTASAPTVATSSLDVIAAQHATGGSVAMNSHKLTGLAAGTGNGDSVRYEQIPTDATISVTDVTTNNVSTSAHGFAPKGDNNTAHFLRGDASWAAVSDANLSVTDITTNNVSASAHGFVAKHPNDASQVLRGDGTWGYSQLYALNTQTSAYTLVLGDAGKIVEMNVSSACTLTIPLNASVAFPTGTVISVFQLGAGQLNIVGAGGVTIDSAGSKTHLNVQYSSGALRKRGTDEWVLAGDLA